MSIREHPQRGIYVDGAVEISVSSPDDVQSRNEWLTGAPGAQCDVPGIHEQIDRCD